MDVTLLGWMQCKEAIDFMANNSSHPHFRKFTVTGIDSEEIKNVGRCSDKILVSL
jgi:hypothetical protein